MLGIVKSLLIVREYLKGMVEIIAILLSWSPYSDMGL